MQNNDQEFRFMDGSTFSDIFGSRPVQPAWSAGTSTNKSESQLRRELERAKADLAFFKNEVLSGLANKQAPAPEIELQSNDESQLSSALGDLGVGDDRIQGIIEKLADEPAEGVRDLLIAAGEVSARSARGAQAKEQRQMMASAEDQNLAVLFNRSQELKLEDAREAGDKAAIAKYSNAGYQVDVEEYVDVYPRLKAEFDYIAEHVVPGTESRDSVYRLTENEFRGARAILDNPQRGRDTDTLRQEDSHSQPAQPADNVQVETPDGKKQPIDLDTLPPNRGHVQDAVSGLSNRELEEALEQSRGRIISEHQAVEAGARDWSTASDDEISRESQASAAELGVGQLPPIA